MSTTRSSGILTNLSTGRLNRTLASPTSLHENFLKCVTTWEIVLSFMYYACVFIAAVFGNTLVIAAYKTNWRLQTTTNTFILGLATADLMVAFISIPIWLYVYSCHYFDITLDPVAYEVYITLDIFIGCASIFQLTAISLERCIAIVWPIRHRGIHAGVFHGMMVLAWVASAFVAGLYPLQLKHWEEGYTAFIFSTCFAGPFVILFGVYILIYDTAVKSRTRVRSELPRATMHREIRVTGTIALVTGVFMIAWFPFFVVTVLATYELEHLPEPAGLLRLIAFVKALHYTNSSLNPMIYGYRNTEMRKTMRGIALQCFPLSRLFRGSFSFPTRQSRSGNSGTPAPAGATLAVMGRSEARSVTPSIITVVTFENRAGCVESRLASVTV